jgi:hypothetical protein
LCSDNTILIRFWKGIGIVRRNLFWPSDEQWGRIEPHLPTDVRGVKRAERVLEKLFGQRRARAFCPPLKQDS